ncbi:MAG: hypothetical protein ABI538_09950 [Pseudoxanthomonas sp.]
MRRTPGSKCRVNPEFLQRPAEDRGKNQIIESIASDIARHADRRRGQRQRRRRVDAATTVAIEDRGQGVARIDEKVEATVAINVGHDDIEGIVDCSRARSKGAIRVRAEHQDTVVDGGDDIAYTVVVQVDDQEPVGKTVVRFCDLDSRI